MSNFGRSSSSSSSKPLERLKKIWCLAMFISTKWLVTRPSPRMNTHNYTRKYTVKFQDKLEKSGAILKQSEEGNFEP